MARPKSTPSQVGRRSRLKGKTFEAEIARDLRDVFDPPGLVKKLVDASRFPKLHRELLKRSRVRRARQSEGAKHSDVVVEDCAWWFELSTSKGVSPTRKLAQAEKDIYDTGSDQLPIVITREKGRQSIQVTVRMGTLMALYELFTPAPLTQREKDVVVQIDYPDLIDRLRWNETRHHRKTSHG